MENNRRTGDIDTMRILATLVISLCLQSGLLAAGTVSDNYEQSILDSIRNIQQQDAEQALETTRRLIQQYPNSRLGQMLYADLLLARTEPLTRVGSGIPNSQALQDLTYEIQQRWQHASDRTSETLLPGNILFLADSQPYVILVDQEKSRVYVYRNERGSLALETDYFITIGLKGSGKQKRGDHSMPSMNSQHCSLRGAFPLN